MPKYNHENFGDVQNHLFAKGVITAVNSEDDTADVTVEGYQDGSGVPLFYHCEPDSEERSNGAIEGAAGGFSVDDEVIVMCTADGEPVRIIGFVDGIKECGGGYLLLKATSFGSGHWFSLWNVLKEEVVDSLTFTSDGEEIVLTFPMEAKLDRPTYQDEVDDDPLYKWLKTRPGDFIEEPDLLLGENNLPEVTLTDTVIFSGGQQAVSEYGIPNTPTFECAMAICGTIAGGGYRYADSCIWTVEDSVPSANRWGTEYNLENSIIWSMNSVCAHVVSPYSNSFDHTYTYTVSIPALREANPLWFGITDSLTRGGPFQSYYISRRETPGVYEAESIRQSSEHIVESKQKIICTNSEYLYPPDYPASPPYVTAEGENSLGANEYWTFTFETLLGDLEPIEFNPVWLRYQGAVPGLWPTMQCQWTDTVYTINGQNPFWLGLPDILPISDPNHKPKNTAIFKHTDKVMFQVYYYSTGITSETFTDRGYFLANPRNWDTVATENMTSVKASVVFAPGETEDIDPFAEDPSSLEVDIMTVHDDFTEAILNLFDATMDAGTSADDNGIRHFDITVYN